MYINKIFKQAAVVLITILCVFYSSTSAVAETVLNTKPESSNYTLATIDPTDTDEISAQLDYFINNVTSLSSTEIVTNLSKILDQVSLKTPEERANYSLKLSKAFREGIGQVSILPVESNRSNYYVLSQNETLEKADEIKNLVDNFKQRAEGLGLTLLANALENECRIITLDYKEDINTTSYFFEAKWMTLYQLKSRNTGIVLKVNTDYAYIPYKSIDNFFDFGNDGLADYCFEYVHSYNYKLAGDAEDISTHIYNDYFDVSTFSYHFGGRFHLYNKSNDWETIDLLDTYKEPVYFFIDYSKYADKITKSRLYSFNFESYNADGNIYTDNAFRFNNSNQIVVTTQSYGPHAIGEYNRTFEDIKSHWARGNIEELASRMYINGKSYETFEPDSKITRAEYAALLTRILGINAQAYNGNFKDVSANDWYATNIQAASDYGLINGYDGYFKPNSNITREEMTTILMRAYKLVYNVNLTGSTDKFEDSAEISLWAKDSIGAAVEKGFILGVTPTTFKPGANATRAEAVTILIRFINYLETIN